MPKVHIPELAMTYVVYWEHLNVMKIGRAWKMHRLRKLTASGGRIVILARDTPAGWERYALKAIAGFYDRAFEDADASLGILPNGRGWTECFFISPHYYEHALNIIFRGIARYESDHKAAERSAVDVHRRAVDGTAAEGAPDGAGVEVLRGRHGSGVGEACADPRAAVAVGRAGDGRGHRDASAAPCRGGVHRPVRGRRPLVLRDRGLAFRGSRRPVEDPCTAASRGRRDILARSSRISRDIFASLSRDIRGRGKGGGRGREERSEVRGSGGAGRRALSRRRTSDVLPGAHAEWFAASVWSLWLCSEAARQVAPGTGRHRERRGRLTSPGSSRHVVEAVSS